MTYVLIFVKSVFMYFVAFSLIRLNRKGIGEQTSYDYTLLIILGTVAADPLAKPENIYSTLVALLGLWTGHKIAVSAVKINRIRAFLHGKPRYLVQAGNFDVLQFYKSKLTVSELYTELRLQGYFRLADIQWALIEPTGKISFIPKPGTHQPPISVQPVIMDGVVQTQTLLLAGKDLSWLNIQLQDSGFSDPGNILIAELVHENKLVFTVK